jgi:crotonobetainyl-CoA:carnitine CoA-transferase CaiB-like acyl-CoA transferase
MAWLSGFPDGPPVIPRGACDPLAGMHAATLVCAALLERDLSGEGRFVELTMVEAALNVAAEVVIEHSAYDAELQRAGNRGPVAAPQGVYACAGTEQWLALAVRGDADWSALRAVLGDPAWAADPELATSAGRRRDHDAIDRCLGDDIGGRDAAELAESLVAAGVPAAVVASPPAVLDNPQLRSRGFIETIDGPVVGQHECLGVPFRFTSRPGPWFETAAPTLGQHNREVLVDVLGLSDGEVDDLAATGVIGERPAV